MLSVIIWTSSSVFPIVFATSVETTKVPGKPKRQEHVMPQAICHEKWKIFPTMTAMTNMERSPITKAPSTTGRSESTSCGVTAVRNTKMDTIQMMRPMP